MIRFLTIGLWLSMTAIAVGQQFSPGASKEERAKRRLDLMKEALADCRIASSATLPAAALAVGKDPLLRYDDPTRGLSDKTDGLLDASVWAVGENGRPTALITLELYRNGPTRSVLSYEFLALTPMPLEVTSPRGPKWAPTSTELKVAPLPKSPRPADSERARLVQMRQLARRFTVTEEFNGNKLECRLLAQPIYRYAGGAEKLLDGAIFAFANGTNPELGLLLECNEREWSYGIVRLSSAALQAMLDGKACYEASKVAMSGAKDSYAGMGYAIDWSE
jgi:hypothetical protein